MPPRWLKNEESEEQQRASNEAAKKDLQQIEIKPELITEAMKPHLDSFRNEVASTMDEKLKAVNEFFAEQNRQRSEAQRKKQSEDETPEETDFLVDPGGAIDKKLAPLIRSQQAANAMIMINETIGEMDYYKSDPEFKAKVLAKINGQPLNLRANPDIIMNCYKLVRYDEDQAIRDGKYKSMLGAASTGGTGSHSGSREAKEDEVTISDDEKVYAKKMGISEADWVKSKKTLEYV